MILEFIFIGIISGLLGFYYRNLLKGDGMLLQSLYDKFNCWVEVDVFCKTYPTIAKEEHYNIYKWAILSWIAHPLGYCIYCNTTWIAIILYTIYMVSWDSTPSWHWVLIGLLTVISISHFIVVIIGKWVLPNHPDFD